VGNLDIKLDGYFKLAANLDAMWIMFIMIYATNLYTNYSSYSEFSFVMADVGNLYAKLGGYFVYFL
jgi:hypothetical protein